MDQLTAVLIGAGGRGFHSYASYALDFPHELKIVAVAEPNASRRASFAEAHGIPEQSCYESWEPLLEQSPVADIALICTQDRMHFEPVMLALKQKYHVLLEKPMSPSPMECIQIERAAKENGRLLTVCHVMRYAPLWSVIKRFIDEGKIGQIVSIQLNENVGYWHIAHSFVRGPWNNSDTSSPMILAKSCHDMDMLAWLMDQPCTRVSSFGSLMHFHSGNAPEGSTDFCIDGCAVEATCPYSAPRFYLSGEGKSFYSKYFTNDFTGEPSRDKIVQGLRESSYGRCVYKSDNNVVDHQVVNMEFANGATATFSMCGFTLEPQRVIQIMGTKGEIRGQDDQIVLRDFLTHEETRVAIPHQTGHDGADKAIMRNYLHEVRHYHGQESRSSASASVQSHMMAFAAEQSRLRKGASIELAEFYDEIAESFTQVGR
ncbi:Gfo/Idh/MocA family protein [Cohnella abietis]|uniref:Oxidoreductase n=1 Tax=Cohnella abietis TaxID=2507935 RepID=A0A3T1D3U1_9BACL|nr:Gfo/Idh/MocA family oxidoreductase [Cohnella abietis]BBI32773.1 oxidoreductase [Cohnella abietis]